MPESGSSARVVDQPPPVSPNSQPVEELAGNRLLWEHTIWGSHPKWVVEPNMARIASHLQQLWTSSCNLTLAPRWGRHQSYIIRVSLPVDAYYKTASEVATIKYLHAHTSIPIPDVFAWDASDDNPIGFEWILMERVSGIPLQEVWYPEHMAGSVDWHIKERTVERLAEVVAQMWRLRFPVGGSLYLADGTGVPGPADNGLALSDNISVTVGRVVSLEFFWENHLQLTGIERGPFRSSGPWLESRLRFVIADAERVTKQV